MRENVRETVRQNRDERSDQKDLCQPEVELESAKRSLFKDQNVDEGV